MNLKEQLLESCKMFVNNRLQTIQEILASNQKALTSEVKSSAGDKHETGRAMLQLEMEKASQQLHAVTEMNATLLKINTNYTPHLACLGSLIYTNLGIYFLSISAGKITINGTTFFAISIASPIGKVILGKKENAPFLFNGKQIVITKIE